MSDDFFGDLGKHISKYTRRAADSTGAFIEATKISSQIAGEERTVEKLYRELGEAVYKLALGGAAQLDEDGRFKADQITAHRKKVHELKAQLAQVRGMKICPHCGEIIEKDVSFCPKCGAPIEKDTAETREKKTGAEENAGSEDTAEDGAVDASYEPVGSDAAETESQDAAFETVKDDDASDADFVPVSDDTSAADESADVSEETAEASMDAEFTVIEDKPAEKKAKEQ